MQQAEYEQTVVTYNAYLERMADASRHFCEDLLDSNYQEISGVLPALIDGISWVNEVLEGLVTLGRVPGNQLLEFRQNINNLHEALENKDNVLLYDLLQFDVIPLFERLKIKPDEVN